MTTLTTLLIGEKYIFKMRITATPMGGIFTNKISIICDTDIYKLSENVFSYGKLNFDENYILKICFLLDKGIKFVPHNIENLIELYDQMYRQIDNSLVQFNKLIFLEKMKAKNSELNLQVNSSEFEENIQNSPSVLDDNADQLAYSRTNLVSSNPFKNINKRSQNYKNIPLQKETIRFRENILNDCKTITSNLNNKQLNELNNLNEEELKILKDFCLKKPFRILKCDKNVGSILISNDNEDLLASKILADKNTYK